MGSQGHPHRSTLGGPRSAAVMHLHHLWERRRQPRPCPSLAPHGHTQEAHSCQEQLHLSHGSTCFPLGCHAVLSLQSRQCRCRVRHNWVTEQHPAAEFTKLAVWVSVCVWHSHRERPELCFLRWATLWNLIPEAAGTAAGAGRKEASPAGPHPPPNNSTWPLGLSLSG